MVEIQLDARVMEDYNYLKHLKKLKLNHDVKEINQCNRLQTAKGWQINDLQRDCQLVIMFTLATRYSFITVPNFDF